MRRFLTHLLVVLTCLSLPASARAQDDGASDSVLGRFLEDNLSGENRNIRVTGLEGGFSARATIKSLTVSDPDGVWLTINGAVLDWNRLALVKGDFSVNTLSADEIIIARKPLPTPEDPELPTPEAKPFSLPELPVAINISEISAGRVVLGEPLVGVAAELSVTGNLALAGGALDTSLDITRLDNAGDHLTLAAKYDNASRIITLDLDLTEAEGGLVARSLQIPGAPPVNLQSKGTGPVDSFGTDIVLATDGTERIRGRVELTGQTPPKGQEDLGKTIGFTADVAGDVTALLEPDFHQFFGDLTTLGVTGKRDPDGRLEVERLDLVSDALLLNGALELAAEGGPERVFLRGQIAPTVGRTVTLPISGPRTSIAGAGFLVSMDTSVNNIWDLTLTLDQLARPDVTLQRAELKADGYVDPDNRTNLGGKLVADLRGLNISDPKLNQAVGNFASLRGTFDLPGEGRLKLQDFVLSGADYAATVDGLFDGLDSGFHMDGKATVRADDIARFSGLAGRPLTGAIRGEITGQGAPLSGSFDFVAKAQAQGVTSGIAQLDALMPGETTLVMSALRDENGFAIRDLDLDGTAITANGSATISSQDVDTTFEARLDDLGRVLPEAPGPLTLSGTGQKRDGTWSGDVRVDGPNSSFADISGAVDPDGTIRLSYDAMIDQLQRFAPEVIGSLTSSGDATLTGNLWRIDINAQGPAGLSADVAGTFNQASKMASLEATGQVQLGAANRFITPNSVNGTANFDLLIEGPPALNSVSGTLSTSGVSVAIPQISNAIQDLGGTVSLRNGSASLAMSGGLRTGGRFDVTGPVSLAPPFNSTVNLALQQIILTDNVSYETSADGQLTYSGPLTGNGQLSGQVNFGPTEINIAAATGGGAAPVPPIRHIGEPSAVRTTRARAGLVEKSGKGAGPVIGLDLEIVAENKVFVRGRGLDAELAGRIQIKGTTAKVVPSGQIGLVRGRLDIFGRRLDLTKGLVTLQGSLQPFIEFAATSNTSDGIATLEIIGPLSAPEINAYSDPERPSEEALAMLIFGNQFATLSPFKLAQLAASLNQLRGGGGGATEKVRRGLGVDSLDLTSDADGNAEVGAGAYVSDKVYTDVSVNTKGDTELNINLDVTDNLTLKGMVDNRGDSAIGFFFERDY